jgi:predicted nucleotidyltransferase
VADVQAAAVPLALTTLITGAFARDLHLWYGHGIETERATEDVDFAFALPDWEVFHALRGQLIASGNFAPRGEILHKLRHRQGLPVDLVPFGGVESERRNIAWPPAGDESMNVFGYREALKASAVVQLPQSVSSRVVSLPGLALLKIVCWQDRHLRSPGRDAQDLWQLMANYLAAGNEARLWNDYAHWTESTDFDYELAGARMLGLDMGTLLDADGRRSILGLLRGQAGTEATGRLLSELRPHGPDRALGMLRALLQGVSETMK